MTCSNCGAYNEDTAKFCASCGSPLSAPVQQAPPMAPTGQAPYMAPPMAPPPMAAPGMAPSPAPMYTAPAPGMAPPPQGKPYKTEHVLGLIGSIVGIVMFLIMLIAGLATTAGLSYGLGYYGYGGALVALTIVASILALVSFILGFVGTAKVGRGDGKGGITLTVAGGLGFLAMFFGLFGWLSLFFYPLLLTAGIMALARRKKVESGMYR